MNCKQCNLIECATDLMGAKRQNKDKRNCYDSKVKQHETAD